MPPKRLLSEAEDSCSAESSNQGAASSQPAAKKHKSTSAAATEKASGITPQAHKEQEAEFKTLDEFIDSVTQGKLNFRSPSVAHLKKIKNYITDEDGDNSTAEAVKSLRKVTGEFAKSRRLAQIPGMSVADRLRRSADRCVEDTKTAEMLEKNLQVFKEPDNQRIAAMVKRKVLDALRDIRRTSREDLGCVAFVEGELADLIHRGLALDSEERIPRLVLVQKLRHSLLAFSQERNLKKKDIEAMKKETETVDALTEIVQQLHELKCHICVLLDKESEVKRPSAQKIEEHRQRTQELVDSINTSKAKFRRNHTEKAALVGEDLLTPWVLFLAEAGSAGSTEKEGEATTATDNF